MKCDIIAVSTFSGRIYRYYNFLAKMRKLAITLKVSNYVRLLKPHYQDTGKNHTKLFLSRAGSVRICHCFERSVGVCGRLYMTHFHRQGKIRSRNTCSVLNLETKLKFKPDMVIYSDFNIKGFHNKYLINRRRLSSLTFL